MLLAAGDPAYRRSRPTEVDWAPDGGWSSDFPPSRSVYFKALQPFLPAAVPGFQKVRDEGSTGRYGDVQVSEAERVFASENEEIAVRIIDSTTVAKLADGITAAAQAAKQQPKDVAVPLSLPSSVGYLRFDAAEEKVEANLLVGDRFIVTVSSRGLKDGTQVRRILESLDSKGLSKLAAW